MRADQDDAGDTADQLLGRPPTDHQGLGAAHHHRRDGTLIKNRVDRRTEQRRVNRPMSLEAENEQVSMTNSREQGRRRAALHEPSGDLGGKLLTSSLDLAIEEAGGIDLDQVASLRRVGKRVHVRIHPRVNDQKLRSISISLVAGPLERLP